MYRFHSLSMISLVSWDVKSFHDFGRRVRSLAVRVVISTTPSSIILRFPPPLTCMTLRICPFRSSLYQSPHAILPVSTGKGSCTVILTAVTPLPSLFRVSSVHLAVWPSCPGRKLPLACERNTCETLERLSNYGSVALTSESRFHSTAMIFSISLDVKSLHDSGDSGGGV